MGQGGKGRGGGGGKGSGEGEGEEDDHSVRGGGRVKAEHRGGREGEACKMQGDQSTFPLCRKEALNNYAVAMDLTKVYEEQFQQLYNSLKQVEQDQEYVEFVRENKK